MQGLGVPSKLACHNHCCLTHCSGQIEDVSNLLILLKLEEKLT